MIIDDGTAVETQRPTDRPGHESKNTNIPLCHQLLIPIGISYITCIIIIDEYQLNRFAMKLYSCRHLLWVRSGIQKCLDFIGAL